MARSKAKESSTPMRPAITPEARENQLISLAVDLAEKQLREETASSQVITHYLKMGSMREKLERERLIEENKKLRAQTKAIESEDRKEEFYKKAIMAMKKYQGYHDDESPDDY